MIIKPRYEPSELKLLKYLRIRLNLTSKEESYYSKLEKGYQGERTFDKWIEPHLTDKLALNDLLLECSNTLFQIDSMVITSNTVYLFEVKNYEGDFYLDGDRWYTNAKTEIKNPLLQVKRNESLVRRLLQELGYSLPIQSYLIFVNPEFHLYQAPLHSPIVSPAQLNRFITKLNKIPSTIKDTHLKLANHLRSMHLNETSYKRLPPYEYNMLQKGIPCPRCLTFYKSCMRTTFHCHTCGYKERIDAAVMRSVSELQLLFPNTKITTNIIQEWCEVIDSKKIIWKVLSSNLTPIGYGKSCYYISKE
ncbi:NERD domain-containing protein [Alkalihalobacillus sp. MEB130]|uniref:nuclease-related domain-containing protein n=1 Tax=Alkalihalobacillus sp. MEB130 TaxID=2976704 RepID=UPI0028DF8565|nr:nuclease-related domain-containing protein [Alkalihalobacillus sp. MEB130]MDT8860183.1 NERD domain-containing protein [Alkalihalobacillus sp. MEB130]